MGFPEAVRTVAAQALREIHDHPFHEYGPGNRKLLVDTFHALEQPLADRAVRWLAVLAARKSLFKYERFLTPDMKATLEDQAYVSDLPQFSLTMAERVLLGNVSRKQAFSFACDKHYTVGNMMHFTQPAEAHFANVAANRALVEASDTHAMEVLWSKFNPIKQFWISKYDEDGTYSDITPKILTDSLWAFVGGASADCVSAAATACACLAEVKLEDVNVEDTNVLIDTDLLLEFWRWYLTEALSEAWKRAEATQSISLLE